MFLVKSLQSDCLSSLAVPIFMIFRKKKKKKPVQIVNPAKGTTIIALIFKEGVMAAAGSRASTGRYEGGNGVQQMSPHEDQDVSINRSKCFKRLFPNQSDLHQVYAEYGAFSSGSVYFNKPHVVEARMFQDPISWWANHGASAPLLQSLDFKLLNQPTSSSCCERNWSTYSVIQNVKRNKLACITKDLVFVHSNLRLLSRQGKEYKEGPTEYWDIFGDQLDIEGRDVIELAALSLDELVLEKISFDDGDSEIASMQQENAVE